MQMLTSVYEQNKRTLITSAVLLLAISFAYSDLRLTIYGALMPMFEWFETTPFGYVGKTWGAAFATVQAVHLVGLGVLGGAVIAADGRLLGLLLTDVPANTVVERSHRVFVWALISLLATGIFMACGVAMKIYYLPVYWYKMLALGAGILFHFYIRKPLLAHDIDSLNPVVVKLVAIASILVWFMVAATGRWIGFSG
jgi:hypothetical protein